MSHEIPDILARVSKEELAYSYITMTETIAALEEELREAKLEPKPKCPDCNYVGMSHCSNPEHCGGVYWPDHLYRELEAKLAALEWVSVKDGMPRTGLYCNVVYSGTVQKIAYCRIGIGFACSVGFEWRTYDETGDPMPDECVTHWMYLPNPPQESEQ